MVVVLMAYQTSGNLANIIVQSLLDCGKFNTRFDYQSLILIFKDVAITEAITS